MKTPQLNRQQFLANLEKSGLLSAVELQTALAQLPQSDEGRDLAFGLVRAGTLTRYQAELLLSGRTRALVIGQYTLLKQRGKGGLGKVYKAIHKTMNRVVALKVLAPQFIKTDKARELFLREVVAVGRLVHPNIVTAYDANTTGERLYLVMEYVAGPDLEQLVARQGHLRPSIACEIIRQAALGLQYAFEMGMLHRDIKPGNLLLQHAPPSAKSEGGDKGGVPWVVKLVDFGLARVQAAGSQSVVGVGTIMTKENTVMGTPDYLSPEQSRDLHKVDIRSDLYSLGCTFYFLLAGRVPFPGGTALDKMIRHSSEEPTPLELVRAEIPVEIAQIVRRLMAKNPEDRFQTPGELAQALAPLAATGSAADLQFHFKEKPAKQRPITGKQRDGAPEKRSTAPEHKASATESARVETVAPSSCPTPVSGMNRTPATASAEKGEDNTGPYGLFIALGMVGFIILLAIVLSLLR